MYSYSVAREPTVKRGSDNSVMLAHWRFRADRQETRCHAIDVGAHGRDWRYRPGFEPHRPWEQRGNPAVSANRGGRDVIEESRRGAAESW